MPDPLLRLCGLRKNYDALTVVDDVSMTVAVGEIHAVVGPNGAGKTTLMALISGSAAPDGGSVHLDERDITRQSLPRRARLGMGRCFQVTTLIPDFTALENAALAAQSRAGSSFRLIRPAGRDAALNRRAMAALEQVGLADRAHVAAAALSHGEARQLELAVVLAAEPRLLLLDEPLAGAGLEETERLVALLAGLRQRYGVLLVEHDMQAVFALADRISVLVQGRLVVTGDAEAVRAHPEVRSAYLGEDAIG
jgi:branched-chain amino acid transport system ATP-binding protein